jgi:predicted small lipoprotein YifL
MPRAVVFLLSLSLAACGALGPVSPAEETPAQAGERRSRAPRPAYNLSGYPPAAREGYIDGCESARKSAYAGKDPKRFSADAQYRMGWDDGFSICSRK